MNRRFLSMVFGLLLLSGLLVANARADEDNREIVFSINHPVEVPTAILAPGRYDLKLVGDGSSIAELWKADGSRFYGFFDTSPVDRKHAGKTKVVLAASGKDAPERIQEWFYPGDKIGNELLYPTKPHREVEG